MWRPVIRLSKQDRHLLEAASDSSVALRSDVAALTKKVAELQAALNEPPPRRLARPLTAAVIAMLALATGAGLIWGGAQALGDPTVTSANLYGGTLFFGVAPDPKDDPHSLELQYGIRYDLSSDRISYQYLLPKKYVDRRFAIIITGPALTTIDTTFTTPGQQWTNCPGVKSCRILFGTVQGDFDGMCTGDVEPRDLPKYASVTFGGSATLKTSPDWAHQAAGLPYISRTSTMTGVTSLNDISLPASYRFMASIQGCINAQIPDGAEITDLGSGGTVLDNGREVQWRHPLMKPALVMKRPDADVKGNVGIASGGALAGLSVGFAPMLVESAANFRRRRKNTFHQKAT